MIVRGPRASRDESSIVRLQLTLYSRFNTYILVKNVLYQYRFFKLQHTANSSEPWIAK
jgi:hypothetical protein